MTTNTSKLTNLTKESYLQFVKDWKESYKKLSSAIRSYRLAMKDRSRVNSVATPRLPDHAATFKGACAAIEAVWNSLPDNFPLLAHPSKKDEVIAKPYRYQIAAIATYMIALRKTGKQLAQESYLRSKAADAGSTTIAELAAA